MEQALEAHGDVRYFLDIRLTDGGKVDSLTRRDSLYPQRDSWYSFVFGV
jgi:hypothetical protein